MKKRLISLFYVVFGVCFTFIIVNVVMQNEYYKAFWLILITAVCIGLLAAIYRLLGRYENFQEKHYNKILIAFAVVMFLIEMIMGLILRYSPAWDVGAIHNGAIEWVETGTFRGYYEYFCYFPNNLGAMAFLFVFFKAASTIGITDYYAVSVFITSVMLVITMTLVSLTCRKLADVKHGIFAFVLFAFSVQYWFMGGAVYTDALSMMFPVLIYWLYLKSKEKQGKQRILLYVLMGVSAAIGSLNKFTVLIMVIAVVIDMCFNERPKEILKAVICFVGIIAIVMVSFNGYIYSKHLDKDMKNQIARPYNHWVMMGLKGDGRYNGADYKFTDSFSNPRVKREEINKEIVSRIKNLGCAGIYKLITRKSAIDFGDGTYGIADFLGISPQNNTKLHDWVLYEGKHFNKYATYATSMYIAIMIVMLLAVYEFIFRDCKNKYKLLAPYAAVFGVWLFLLCWETNRRYFSNFAPVIFICGTLGINSFIKAINKLKCELKKYLK